MNIVSFLIGTGINLFYSPFSENSENYTGGGGLFPFNVLKSTPACRTIDLSIGDNRLKFTSIPRGYCTNCCPVKLTRDVKFVLYNPENSVHGIPIKPFDRSGSAQKAGVNPTWPTVIYIHGFSEASPGESGRAFIDAYLALSERYNVILLDWSELAPFPWYRTAAQNVKIVGKVLRRFIKLYNQTGEMPAENLHLIGFSLGSHVASAAGKGLQGAARIPRITALDPAYPEFPLQDRRKRLAESDADYVDVIHTDAGVFGIPVSIGHADFYPNGGRALQPGCQPSYLARQNVPDQVLACSHVRAWKLYVESVTNPQAFPATRCPDKRCNFTLDAYMGFNNRGAIGQFYLKTSYKSPFSLSVDQQIM